MSRKKPHRKVRIRRPEDKKSLESTLDRAMVREEIKSELAALGFYDVAAMMKNLIEVDHNVLYGFGVILWDMRVSIETAVASGGSTQSILGEVLQNLTLAFSTLEELLTKDEFEAITRRGVSEDIEWPEWMRRVIEDDEQTEDDDIIAGLSEAVDDDVEYADEATRIQYESDFEYDSDFEIDMFEEEGYFRNSQEAETTRRRRRRR